VTAPLLSVEGLCKSYGALVVSDHVSLDVIAGELHALIGPNGAGKTTLINQMSGATPSDSGRIVFAGEDVTRLDLPDRVRRGLARSFQITSILPDFSVRDNVALAVQARSGSSFRFFGRASAEADLNLAAERALRRVGLASRAGACAGLLSHGEKRLLELACAIATAPKLLLLDEPFAGLGQDESRAAIYLLRTLKSEFSIVLVEHDMDAVFSLADRVSVLVSGRVIATGAPVEIARDPQVRAAYLGDEEAV